MSRFHTLLLLALLAGLIGCHDDLRPLASDDAVPLRYHRDTQLCIFYASDAFEFYMPDWSPTGQFVIFSSYDPWGFGTHLVRWDLDRPAVGVAPRVLQSTSGAGRASISPDGSTIAFSRAESLYVVPASGGPVTFLHFPAADPAWSPEGGRLVCTETENEAGPSNLAVIDLATQQVAFITFGSDNNRMPCWIDQNRVLYASSAPRPGGLAGRGLWIVATDGSAPTHVEFDLLPQGSAVPVLRRPDLSPAGDHVAIVVSWGDGMYQFGSDLARLPIGGGTIEYLVSGGDRVTGDCPVWSPDGSRLLCVRDEGGGYRDLWLASNLVWQ